MIDPTSPPGPRPTPPGPPAERREALREAATALEASFLAEMLTAAGLGQTREALGGGAGEDAFGSLLVREQAEVMARGGGIGLAEQIYRSLLAREGPDAGTGSGS